MTGSLRLEIASTRHDAPAITHSSADTLYGIQFLRFAAAMMVVLRHSSARTDLVYPDQGFAGWSVGSAGVDIFFVISGFIMVHVTTGRDFTPWQFWKRRLLRIVPLYWLATLVGFAATTAFPLYFFGFAKIQHLLTSMFFIPFPIGGHHKVVPVIPLGWTLNLEMPFYALLALSMFARRAYIVVALCMLFALFTVSYTLTGYGYFPRFYAGGGLWLEFALGILLALLIGQVREISPLAGIALMAVGAVCLWFGWYGGNMRLFGAGLPSFLIVAGAVAAEPLFRRPQFQFFILVGDASYAIYIVHMIFMNPLMWIAYRNPDSALAAIGPWPFWALLATGGLALGLATHIWVEKPMLAFTRARIGRRRQPTSQ